MSVFEAFSWSTRVSSSAINKAKAGQTTSSYYQQVPDKAVVYLYSCCGETCSSAPVRRSSPACLGFHYISGRRRCPASTASRRRAPGPSQAILLRPRPGVPCCRTPEACRTSAGTSPRRRARTTDVNWVLNTEGLTTQRCRLLTFIHCSAWRTASR
jgi:hypothetical protein